MDLSCRSSPASSASWSCRSSAALSASTSSRSPSKTSSRLSSCSSSQSMSSSPLLTQPASSSPSVAPSASASLASGASFPSCCFWRDTWMGRVPPSSVVPSKMRTASSAFACSENATIADPLDTCFTSNTWPTCRKWSNNISSCVSKSKFRTYTMQSAWTFVAHGVRRILFRGLLLVRLPNASSSSTALRFVGAGAGGGALNVPLRPKGAASPLRSVQVASSCKLTSIQRAFPLMVVWCSLSTARCASWGESKVTTAMPLCLRTRRRTLPTSEKCALMASSGVPKSKP
mmetsp:Transcript_29931/g.90599  ORF Transcript_29931/g.90599 Transcript_29931/m.90599 type:complete len:288 (-) Transcript_29931:121-984(-)